MTVLACVLCGAAAGESIRATPTEPPPRAVRRLVMAQGRSGSENWTVQNSL